MSLGLAIKGLDIKQSHLPARHRSGAERQTVCVCIQLWVGRRGRRTGFSWEVESQRVLIRQVPSDSETIQLLWTVTVRGVPTPF